MDLLGLFGWSIHGMNQFGTKLVGPIISRGIVGNEHSRLVDEIGNLCARFMFTNVGICELYLRLLERPGFFLIPARYLSRGTTVRFGVCLTEYLIGHISRRNEQYCATITI